MMRIHAIAQETETKERSFLFTIFSFAVIFSCIFFLSACMPSGEQDVNTELFKDKADMQERTSALKNGMSKKAAFTKLNIPMERFERMRTLDVQMYVYGNAQVQGTPSELEGFKRKIMSYEGYMLPYREIKESSSLGFGTMQVEKTGHDLRLVMIFEKGRLMSHSLEGTQDVKQQEEKYLWETLIKRGIGFAF